METHWEKSAGDKDRFAFRVAFMDDPDNGQGADPDDALSWGSFQLWVKGRNLCAHEEQGERVESANWYLLPLLEWFVHNWEPLLHEERLPCKNVEEAGWASLQKTWLPPRSMEDDQEAAWKKEWQDWWMRHAIHAASEGGIFPDLVIRRLRDTVEFSWGPLGGVGIPHHVKFDATQSDFARFAPRDVAEPLYEVLLDAVKHLGSMVPSSTRIKKLIGATRKLRNVHRQDSMMWLAGLGANEQIVRQHWQALQRQIQVDFSPTQQKRLLETTGNSQLVIEGSCHAALMYGSVSPDINEQDVLTLAKAILQLDIQKDESGPLTSMCRTEPIDDSEGTPWVQGYGLAEEIFEDHIQDGFSSMDCVNIEQMLSEWNVEVIEMPLSDDSIRGVSIAGPQHRPGVAWNPKNPMNATPQGRRFTLAHELCHLLFDRDIGQRLAVASGPWAPRDIEKRANAFAAMLLMPWHLVHSAVAQLNEPLATETAVANIARKLQTGFSATLRHLNNLEYITDFEQEQIEVERQSRLDAMRN